MFPDTLLGSPDKDRFWRDDLHAYYFDRNREFFVSVQQFYQLKGSLMCWFEEVWVTFIGGLNPYKRTISITGTLTNPNLSDLIRYTVIVIRAAYLQ